MAFNPVSMLLTILVFIAIKINPSFCSNSLLIEEFKIISSDNHGSDFFGQTVSISNGVAIVGAWGNDDQGSSSGSAYIFRLDITEGIWIQTHKLTASDGGTNDYFGETVAISKDTKTVVIGAYGDATSSGSAYIFEYNDLTDEWIQTAKLIANDRSTYDLFSFAVSISDDGMVAIIGARWEDEGGSNSGAAYVFEKIITGSSSSWEQTAKLKANDAVTNDEFGYSVSIANSGDLYLAIIGAHHDDDMGSDSGSVYVFEKNEPAGLLWIQTAKLTANDGQAVDVFGYSISISIDVTNGIAMAIVGAYGDDDLGSLAGSAYIFERDIINGGFTWNQVSKLYADDGRSNDFFSWSVSISNNIAIIGANFDDDKGSSSGSAYIFIKDGSSSSWTQATKLTASDGAQEDFLGTSVAISRYNTNAGIAYVIAGAWGDDDNGGKSGSAYIYSIRLPVEVKLTASDDASYDYFGKSASIGNNIAIIGSYGDDDNGASSGSAYIFEYNILSQIWIETYKIKPDLSDAGSNDYFGYSVDISENGNTIIIGSYRDGHSGSYSGSVYIFEKNNIDNNWIQTSKLIANDATSNQYFGQKVSISNDGTVAIIGARGDSVNSVYSGAVYIFKKDISTGTQIWIQTYKLKAFDATSYDYFGRSVSISNNNNYY